MFEHILVPLDGSSLAECALPHAMGIGHVFGAKVTLLRIAECVRDPRSRIVGVGERLDVFLLRPRCRFFSRGTAAGRKCHSDCAG
jgi:nucleotide-binding universal stress UspA family protein